MSIVLAKNGFSCFGYARDEYGCVWKGFTISIFNFNFQMQWVLVEKRFPASDMYWEIVRCFNSWMSMGFGSKIFTALNMF